MACKGLVPFVKLGSTFDLVGEITPTNAIVPIGDLSMEKVQALEVEPLAVVPPEG